MTWKGWLSVILSTSSLTSLLVMSGSLSAQTLPTGGGFVAGSGGIATTGATMTVTQQGSRGIVNWNSFSIGQGAKVAFENGGGATLNRVSGGNPSAIAGSLTATGSVYLINPAGVVVGPTGTVTTGGSFVASTHDVPSDDFMSAKPLTFKGDSTAKVENLGAISSSGGDVLLIAREVSNKGTLSAPNGTAALAGGHEVLLTEETDSRRGRVLVRAGTGQVDNQGTIAAAQVELRAAGGNVYALAGNNGGIVRATGSANRSGQVWLTAGDGHVQNSGSISAVNADGDGGRIKVATDSSHAAINTGTISASGATGGKVKVSAGRVSNQGRIKADGATGAGGKVTVKVAKTYVDTAAAETTARGATAGGKVAVTGTAADSTLFTSGTHAATGATGGGGSIDLFAATINAVGATLDASGATRGGGIRVGGDYQGSGDMLKAGTVTVTGGTTMRADASGPTGDGGRIVVWSEDRTSFAGAASARGGTVRGDGGLIEVSSHDTLVFAGLGDAGATAGTAGTLLLDPRNIVISSASGVTPQFDLVDPNPAASNAFGASVQVLSGGNILVTSSGDDFSAANAGAVYLFNGTTGALISALYGAIANQTLGLLTPTTLANGNFVVRSTLWGSGTVSSAGAVAWGSGVTGVAGAMSSSNSLVGSATNDKVGNVVNALPNGSFVTATTFWSYGTSASAGAVTWGSGTAGVTGVVSSTNSLVGTSANDKVGSVVTTLANSSYLVSSTNWSSGTVASAGAATWGSGTAGVTGTVSSSNSLVGSRVNDTVGSSVSTLSNGNYVVRSTAWYNGGSSAGAVTWGSGTAGVTGEVSSTNSLVGTSTNDKVGTQFDELTNGNYVVRTSYWTNGTAASAGAATWASGTAAITGTVSSSNSLVGSSSNDKVGAGFITLSSGNYLINTTSWTNGTAVTAGAVAWGNGTTGVTGTVSSSNSLVGSSSNDRIGTGITTLSNGNYVVASSLWSNGGLASAGAVTWGNGTTGVSGVVSATNSLVGSSTSDSVGTNIATLGNGNYVVNSSYWSNGGMVSAGAATWVDGTTGLTGVVSATNSLVGSRASQRIGFSVTALTNGNYVVATSATANGTATNVGSVTWANGTLGVTGTVSTANSLMGSNTGDQIYSVTALSNGNYVVTSSSWANGTATSAGAATWGDGSTGITGTVSSSNSLVGTTAGDRVGLSVVVLTNGNYVVRSSVWSYNGATSAGAVTWGDGTAGVTGAVSSSNSLVGTSAADRIGTAVTTLSNGNYVVTSTTWRNGTASFAGAATWGSGTAGVTGIVSASNSLVGSAVGDAIGSSVTKLTNGNYLVTSIFWSNGTAQSAGAVTWGNGTAGVSGVVSAANSLVGSQATDKVGASVTTLANGNYLLRATSWSNGTVTGAGAVTWGNGTTGVTGVVSASNSLVGTATGTMLAAAGANETYLAYSSTQGVGGRVTVGAPVSALTYAMASDQTVTIQPDAITAVLNTGTALTLQANNDITVSSDVIVNNPAGNGGAFTLSAGRSILLDANITTDNGNFTAIANAKASSGVVDAQRASGAAVITMAPGKTIDAGTGAITLTLDSGAGNTNTTSGAITLGSLTGGTITVDNAGSDKGDITINSGAVLAASGSGDALVLATSSGGNFVNNGDSTVLSTPNGRWLVYSADPALNTLGGLTGTAQYSITYSGTPPGSVTGTGSQLLYSRAPASILTFSALDATITYGDTLPTYTYSYSGLTGMDTLSSVITGTPTLSSTAVSGSGVGTYTITIDLSGVSINSGFTSAYTLGSVTATLTIVAKTLTATGGRVYDGTTDASGLSLSGIVGSDAVSLGGTGAVADKNVGTGKTVSGLSLAGAGASNYTLGGATLDITAKSLTATGDRVYDGTTDASGLSLSGIVGSDAVSIGGTGAVADKNVGTGKTVSGLSLAGAGASNYTLGGATLDITAKSLTATGDRIYDGTTDASGLSLSGIVGSDAVSIGGSGAVADKNVGTGKTVTGLSLAGAGASNYTLGGATLDITAKSLTATGDRVYDGTTDASGLSLSGVVGSDAVSLGGTGAVADKNVSTGKTVTGLSLAGAGASNYTLGGATLDITAKSLTATGDRVYDGTTDASGLSLSGVVGSDAVSIGGTGAVTDKNVGTGKTVSGLSLAGAGASNYTLGGATLDITAKTLTATGDRVYDGTTDASGLSLSGIVGSDAVSLGGTGAVTDKNVGTGKTVSGLSLAGAGASNYTLGGATLDITAKSLTATGGRIYDGTTDASGLSLSGIVGSDAVSLGGTGAVADKNVGTGKTVSGLSLAGAGASNYTLGGATLDITAKSLTATGDRVYDGTTDASGLSLSGIVGSDAVSIGGTGAVTDKNVGTGKTVSGLSLAGAGASNYTLGGATLDITAKSLTATGGRVYDGTTDASGLSLSGIVGSDAVSLGGTGAVADKNVGTGKTVTGLSLAGAGASNYTLGGATLDITAKSLTATGDRVYDGTTDASGLSLSGVVGSDTVSLGGSGAVADKNVGTGKTVTGLSLAGAGASNYTLGGATLDITAKTLTASGDRIYDGTTDASGLSLSGIVGSDAVSIGGTGAVTDKNVGTGKTVTGLSLAGAGASNYTLGGATLDITAKSLTATGDRVYDGTTDASGLSLSGVVGSDTVSLGGSGAVADKNVGTGKTVTGLSLAGAGASNYTLGGATLDITAKTLTATGDRVYDGTTDASGLSLSGIVGSDAVSLGGTGAVTDKNVGTGKTVTGLSLAGAGASNYTLGGATLDITAKSLTATGDRVYDGTTDASGLSLSGIVGSDAVSLGGTGAVADKNVGTGKTVSGLSLAGAGANNYTLGGATLDITAKTLTATGDRVYDGTTDASGLSLSGIVGSDAVSLGGTGAVADKNVGTGKTVTGLSLAGAGASNYTLGGATLDITAKTLTASSSRVYDGTTAASGLSLSGVVGSDAVSLGGTGAVADKNVGTGKTVSGLSLAGAGASNYTLGGATLDITAKTLTATGDRVYDGTTAASGLSLSGIVGSDAVSIGGTGAVADKNVGTGKTVSGLSLAGAGASNYTLGGATLDVTAKTLTATGDRVYDGTTDASGLSLSGIVGSDAVSLGGTGAVADKNVGTGKTVSGLSLAGAGASNYTLGGATLDITAKSLTASGDRVYDGTTAASGLSLSGIVGSDAVSLGGTGAVADKNVGTGKTVSGLSLAGAGASNYTLGGATLDITAKTLTASGDRVYDGTTDASGLSLSGIVGSDAVSLGGTGAVADKNVGTGKTVTGLSLAGAGASNYTLGGATLDITAKTLTATGDRVYDGTTDASGLSLSGIVGSDAVSLGGTGAVADKNVGTGKTVSGLSLAGAGASNYTLGGATLDITAKSLTATGDRVYDGTTDASGLSLSGIVGSDAVSLGGTGAVADKNVGTGKTVSGLSLAGAGASNYTLGGATLDITAKSLTATGDRIYDGTTDASGLSLSGIVGSDAVSIGGTGAVADKNVGTGKTVTGLSLAGAGASNYTLGGATLDITAKTLTATGDRVYDGTTDASGLSLSGIVGSDAVSIGGTGAVADKNVGTGKTVSGLSLAGAGASNYTLGGATLDITAKSLTATGDRVYDGTTDASGLSLSGIVGSDAVSLGGTGAVADKNVGTGKTVTGLSLAGAGASNYTLGGATLDITAKSLTATGDRIYDGTTDASGLSLSGIVGSDVVSLGGSGAVADKNVGTGKTVTGLSLAGAGASNYTLGGATLDITAKTLTASSSRVYDGTTDASGLSLSGVVGSDAVSLGGTGAVADKNVGTGKAVTGLSLAGAGASNYTLGGATLDITARTLTAIGDRIYDGTTDASGLSLSGVVSGDTVSVSGGTVNSKTVGSGKSVSGAKLSGGDAGNYTLGAAVYSIIAKALPWSVAGVSATYGDAINLGAATLNGVISGDDIGATVAAFAAGKAFLPSAGTHVGTYSQQVTALTGSDAGNYTLAQNGNSAGSLVVNPAVLSVVANAASKTVGAADPALTYSFNGLRGSDSQSSVLSGGLNRADGDTVGTYRIGLGTLAAISDYIIAFAGADFVINPSTAAPAPTALNQLSALPVVTTPLLFNSGLSVLGSSGTTITSTAVASTSTSTGPSSSSGATAVGSGSTSVSNSNTGATLSSGGVSNTPIIIDASRGRAAGNGAVVENSLSVAGLQVVFRQPANYTPGSSAGSGNGGASGNTGTGAGGGGILASATSFTTFAADSGVQSTLVSDGSPLRQSADTERKRQSAN